MVGKRVGPIRQKRQKRGSNVDQMDSHDIGTMAQVYWKDTCIEKMANKVYVQTTMKKLLMYRVEDDEYGENGTSGYQDRKWMMRTGTKDYPSPRLVS
jgi:hypothetical protein